MSKRKLDTVLKSSPKKKNKAGYMMKPSPKKEKLPTEFDCLFCKKEKTVKCKFDKDLMTGTVKCNNCGEKWSSKIHNLTEDTDLYHDWLDKCEDDNTNSTSKPSRSSPGGGGVSGTPTSQTVDVS